MQPREENEDGPPAAAAPARPARVELIDNWSDRWTSAVTLLDELEHRDVLRLDDEGWLPARQNLLVAFAGPRPLGYLCFRVEPLLRDGALARDPAGRPLMEAVVDGEGALPNAPRPVTRQLREAAMHRALELRCNRFRWEHAEANA